MAKIEYWPSEFADKDTPHVLQCGFRLEAHAELALALLLRCAESSKESPQGTVFKCFMIADEFFGRAQERGEIRDPYFSDKDDD